MLSRSRLTDQSGSISVPRPEIRVISPTIVPGSEGPEPTMSTLTLSVPEQIRSGTGPYEFFVSTTGCAGDLKRHLGSADYSYGFVLRALAPALEALGSCA